VPTMFARATRRVGMAHIRYVQPVSVPLAPPPVARVYGEMERDFGMVAPPLALHAPSPGALAAVWLMLRETLLVPGLVSREAKEVVAAAVSLANRCPYCVEVHGTTLAGLRPGQDAAAVMADRIDDVTSPELRALARWARGSGAADATTRVPAPFSGQPAPELLGVAVTFHYINRMVNIFLRESALPPVPRTASGPLLRIAARILGRQARAVPAPRSSVVVAAGSPLPADLAWTSGHSRIAAAFAQACGAIDAGGTRAVPERVRRLVTARLDEPAALPDPPDIPRWLDAAVAGLAGPEQRAARLALLTAVASYRVTPRLAAEYQQTHGDESLIELTAWASLAAARRVGAELSRGVPSTAGG
jgi:AhpD family alkylhydroperoxidase